MKHPSCRVLLHICSSKHTEEPQISKIKTGSLPRVKTTQRQNPILINGCGSESECGYRPAGRRKSEWLYSFDLTDNKIIKHDTAVQSSSHCKNKHKLVFIILFDFYPKQEQISLDKRFDVVFIRNIFHCLILQELILCLFFCEYKWKMLNLQVLIYKAAKTARDIKQKVDVCHPSAPWSNSEVGWLFFLWTNQLSDTPLITD